MHVHCNAFGFGVRCCERKGGGGGRGRSSGFGKKRVTDTHSWLVVFKLHLSKHYILGRILNIFLSCFGFWQIKLACFEFFFMPILINFV